MIFSIYACGNSVLWILLSIEREDIEYYYCQDGSNGTAYVNSLLDEADQSSSHQSSPAIHTFDWLLKNFATAKSLESNGNSNSPIQKIIFEKIIICNSQEGFETTIFHPPTNSIV